MHSFLRFRLFAASLLLGMGLSSAARAETPADIPNPLQTRRAWVADEANVVSDADEARINTLLTHLEKSSGAEIAVVTVHNLSGQTIEEFANDLFRRWKIGKKGTDNGVLILAAIDDRKKRIEVGYGLEATLTDGEVGAISRDEITPPFKQGDYGGGLYAGAFALARKIDPNIASVAASGSTNTRSAPSNSSSVPMRQPYVPPLPNMGTSRSYPTSSPSSGGAGAGILLLVLLVGGGIGSIVYLASRPKGCPKCGGELEPLSEKKTLQFLSPVQKLEEKLGSRDYRAWRCKKCGEESVTGTDRTFSNYGPCRECGNRTDHITTQIVNSNNPYNSGVEVFTHECQWPECGATWTQERNLPTRPSSSNLDSFTTGAIVGSMFDNDNSSSSSSSSDNSSSSDSSSSFDSGPSDFGGGDSGGGGSSDSW